MKDDVASRTAADSVHVLEADRRVPSSSVGRLPIPKD